jgi:hypothetical protein
MLCICVAFFASTAQSDPRNFIPQHCEMLATGVLATYFKLDSETAKLVGNTVQNTALSLKKLGFPVEYCEAFHRHKEDLWYFFKNSGTLMERVLAYIDTHKNDSLAVAVFLTRAPLKQASEGSPWFVEYYSLPFLSARFSDQKAKALHDPFQYLRGSEFNFKKPVSNTVLLKPDEDDSEELVKALVTASAYAFSLQEISNLILAQRLADPKSVFPARFVDLKNSKAALLDEDFESFIRLGFEFVIEASFAAYLQSNKNIEEVIASEQPIFWAMLQDAGPSMQRVIDALDLTEASAVRTFYKYIRRDSVNYN